MYGIFMLLLLIFSTKVLIIINMQHLVWCTTPSHLRLVVYIIYVAALGPGCLQDTSGSGRSSLASM